MKTYKELLNESVHNGILRQLTEEESTQMKAMLLDMYQDLASVCDAHGLTLMLCGGSCLGAIRHQGFIPWDDDLDMCMHRNDYERLKQLLTDGALGEKYEVLFPSPHHDALCMFMKIYRRDTRCVEIGNEYAPFPKGLSLDVFPVDAVSPNPVKRALIGMLANGMRLCANMVYEATYPAGEVTKRLMAQGGMSGLVLRCRKMLGSLLRVVKHQHWVMGFERLVRNGRPSPLLSIPTGRKLYQGETLPASVFLPARTARFEGLTVLVPGQTEAYLRNLYGASYMQLPPPEKRERHFIVEFDLKGRSSVETVS